VKLYFDLNSYFESPFFAIKTLNLVCLDSLIVWVHNFIYCW